MKICVAFYVVILINACTFEYGLTTEVPIHANTVINSQLIQKLFETLDAKSEIIEELLKRVDRLELREEELQKQNNVLSKTNDALSRKVNELEILDLKHEKEINDLRTEIRTHHADVDTLLNAAEPVASNKRIQTDIQNNTTYRTKRQAVAQDYEGNHVAFFVGLTTHLYHQGTDQPIVFDTVIMNIGNAYNVHAGDFRAPVAGTYVFSVTIMAYDTHSTHYYFAKNGRPVSRLYDNGHAAPYSQSSETVVIELNQGDDFSFRNVDADEALRGDMYTTFAGFLLREKNSDIVVG